MAGDADAALARIGRTAIAGAGLGAYVALLVAGARADSVRGALLLPGTGLAGAGPVPDFSKAPARFKAFEQAQYDSGAYDPMVAMLERDVRPVDYVEPFARAARRLLLVENGEPQPPWWEAVRRSPTAQSVVSDLRRSFTLLAQTVSVEESGASA